MQSKLLPHDHRLLTPSSVITWVIDRYLEFLFIHMKHGFDSANGFAL